MVGTASIVGGAAFMAGWACGFIRAVKVYCSFEDSIVAKVKKEMENLHESR
jgi:hypothetical protein